MAQIEKKWLQDDCIDGNKLDSSAYFSMAGVNVIGDTTVGASLVIDGTWGISPTQGHLIMSGYHLWIDGGGVLRIKSSAPNYDTDGSAVGFQS